ncbi:hypothetical protein HK101_005586, partial [Irineochytrium annulatum]
IWILPSILKALGGADPERLNEDALLDLLNKYNNTALKRKLQRLVQEARTAMGATVSFFEATAEPLEPRNILASTSSALGSSRVQPFPISTIPPGYRTRTIVTTLVAAKALSELPAAKDIEMLTLPNPEIPVRLHFPYRNEYRQKPTLMNLIAMLERVDTSWCRQPFEAR